VGQTRQRPSGCKASEAIRKWIVGGGSPGQADRGDAFSGSDRGGSATRDASNRDSRVVESMSSGGGGSREVAVSAVAEVPAAAVGGGGSRSGGGSGGSRGGGGGGGGRR